jgi:hypothetical protein
MTLTGKAAEDFVAQVHAEARKQAAEQLAEAKADAARRGKEPFDLAKLETMADTSSEGRMDPEAERHARFEHMYYVRFPKLMTLEELAREIEELNKW